MLKLATPTPDGLVPVVSYARISSDGRKDAHGVKDQHKVNRETAARYGWTVVHEFTDNDKSAAKADVFRDEFESMVKALKVGKLPDGTPVRGVVVVADDRLARRPGDFERFVEAFTYNDNFVFADSKQDKNLYSEDVESMGLFGAVISKMEVRKMQRRMRRSHRARAESGKPVGGTRPFGWKPDRMTLDPAEADLVRQAAREFIAGRSLGSIVQEWQRKGVQTPRGNGWTTRSLKATLANPRHCGWRELHGELVRDASGEPVVGQWEPIITTAEWTAVRTIIDSRKGNLVNKQGEVIAPLPQDSREHRFLLTGILRCGRPKESGGICNFLLRVHTRKEGHHLYACQPKSNGGCGGVGRRGDLVDFFISELILNRMEEKAAFKSSDTNSEWQDEAKLKRAQERIEELTRKWDAEEVSDEFFYNTLPRLEKIRNQLRGEKNRHEAMTQRRLADTAIDIDDIRRRWYLPEEEGGMPLSQKRARIRKDLLAVIVHPAGRGRRTFNPDLLEPKWAGED